ncbi:hypothetical protein MMC32_005076 [Xylographa parallela]|nr:hypothetical protein [Xylographa parallela]
MTTNDLLEGAQKGSAYIDALMATNTKAEAANHSASGTTEQDDEGDDGGDMKARTDSDPGVGDTPDFDEEDWILVDQD